MTNDEKGKEEKSTKTANQRQDSSFVIRHSDLAAENTGQTLDITSGSVFRFRPDGSRVELWTSGQVNPFGLCWDSWGNLYSADCHSNPITQLIRGAEYPQFGKPAGPLGFGPVMCDHAHGSTGLCGISYIDGGVWGPEWDDHMFVGNCVTSRVNHDTITFTGSTPKANEAPDFLTSDDPWFRPVDLQLGPDSALYVADFYNRIIGHYEVPLDHPGRDRERGRIWRVVREGYTGKLTECDLSKKDAKDLIDALGSPNIALRYLGTTRVAADVGIDQIQVALQEAYKAENGYACQHLMWSASQISDTYPLPPNPAKAEAPGPRHSFRVLAPIHVPFIEAATYSVMAHRNEFWNPWSLVFLEAMPEDTKELYPEANPTHDPRVSRTWANYKRASLRKRFSFWNLDDSQTALQMLTLIDTAQVGDVGLQHELLVILRELMSKSEVLMPASSILSNAAIERRFSEIAITIQNEASAEWLLAYLKRTELEPEFVLRCFRTMARNLRSIRDDDLVSLAQKHFGGDLDTQLDLLAAIWSGRDSQSSNTSSVLSAWTTELTDKLLASLQSEPADSWTAVTPPTEANPNPWRPQSRRCSDGGHRILLDSHVVPGTEKLTGTLRSAPFALPEKLTFWLAGHRGFPAATAHEKNFVRLVDTETGEELSRAYPPRNDTAQQVSWAFPPSQANPKSEIGDLKSKLVRLELVDGDTASAYAWLAAGGFEPAVVTIPDDPLRRDKRVRYLAEWNSAPSASADAVAWLAKLPDKAGFTPETRQALAEFLANRSPDPSAALLAPLARDAELAPAIFASLQSTDAGKDELGRAFRTLPFRGQARLAAALAGSVIGASRLFEIASPAVLAEPLVSSKLTALNDAATTKRLKELTASLPPQNEALNKLIAQRLKSYDPSKADAKRGEEIFTTVCFICHRIGVRGNLVGPQLDGIGARGAERLLEDIVDPNRAVDPAFRLHMVKRKDGTLYAGLQRREEGEGIVFTDATAQETRIPKADIASNEESPLSLMPPGLGEALTEQQLHDLMAYLLARR